MVHAYEKIMRVHDTLHTYITGTYTFVRNKKFIRSTGGKMDEQSTMVHKTILSYNLFLFTILDILLRENKKKTKIKTSKIETLSTA